MCSLKIRYNINFRYSNNLPTLAVKPRQKLTKDTWPQRSNSMMFIKYMLKTHFCFEKEQKTFCKYYYKPAQFLPSPTKPSLHEQV